VLTRWKEAPFLFKRYTALTLKRKILLRRIPLLNEGARSKNAIFLTSSGRLFSLPDPFLRVLAITVAKMLI